MGQLERGTQARLPDGVQVRGQRLSVWKREAEAVREALETWDSVRPNLGDGGALVSLTGRAETARPELLQAMWDEVGWPIATEGLTVGDLPGDDRAAASEKVRVAVNGALKKHAAPALVRDPKEQHGLSLRLAPASLLGAMWVQFADELCGGRSYRPCESCGAWIALSVRDRRKSARYCNNACRQKAHRERSKRDAAHRVA